MSVAFIWYAHRLSAKLAERCPFDPVFQIGVGSFFFFFFPHGVPCESLGFCWCMATLKWASSKINHQAVSPFGMQAPPFPANTTLCFSCLWAFFFFLFLQKKEERKGKIPFAHVTSSCESSIDAWNGFYSKLQTCI